MKISFDAFEETEELTHHSIAMPLANAMEAPPIDCDGLTTNQEIDPKAAVKYISRFWTFQDCITFGDRYGAGNFIPFGADEVESLSTETTAGIAIFPCIGRTWYRRRTGYYAFKAQNACPSYANPVTIEPNDILNQTNLWIPPFGLNRSETGIRIALEAMKIQKGITDNAITTLSGSQVNAANQDYMSRFEDPTCADFGFGFTKLSHLRNFLLQPHTAEINGFCIFRGLDLDNEHEKIRIILIAVDSNGKLLVNDDLGHICLEKSWPPVNPS